jgi:hypothetical protein
VKELDHHVALEHGVVGAVDGGGPTSDSNSQTSNCPVVSGTPAVSWGRGRPLDDREAGRRVLRGLVRRWQVIRTPAAVARVTPAGSAAAQGGRSASGIVMEGRATSDREKTSSVSVGLGVGVRVGKGLDVLVGVGRRR